MQNIISWKTSYDQLDGETDTFSLCLLFSTLYDQVGPQEPGVVYPGEAEVNVVLDPGDIACLQMTKDSCTVLLEEDGIYRVKVTQTNTVGATINDSLSFNCECKKLCNLCYL